MKHRGHFLGQYGVPYEMPFISHIDVIEGILRESGRIDGVSPGTAKALALLISMKKSKLPFVEARAIHEADLDEAVDELLKNLSQLDETRFLEKIVSE